MRTSHQTPEIDPGLTTFYNASCPICRTEIDHYRRLASKADLKKLSWCDTSTERDALVAKGIAPEDVLKRLYVVDRDGTLYGGVDAFLLIWRAVPGYGWLARAVGLPGIKHISSVIYDYLIAPALFRWNKLTGRI